MATVIVTHDVVDYAAWKPKYDVDSDRRSGAGIKEIAVGPQADNPNKVYLIWDADPATIEGMMKDPELAVKMKEAGVVSEPQVIVVNS